MLFCFDWIGLGKEMHSIVIYKQIAVNFYLKTFTTFQSKSSLYIKSLRLESRNFELAHLCLFSDNSLPIMNFKQNCISYFLMSMFLSKLTPARLCLLSFLMTFFLLFWGVG